MDIMIWFSMAVFLLLPFYLRVFILDFRKTRRHMVFWVILHLSVTVINYVYLKLWWSWPSLMLLLYGGYFICVYISEIRNEKSFEGLYAIEYLVKTKLFRYFEIAVLSLGTVLLAVDSVLIFGVMEEMMFYKVYLFGILVISYVQIILYLKEYKKVFLRAGSYDRDEEMSQYKRVKP